MSNRLQGCAACLCQQQGACVFGGRWGEGGKLWLAGGGRQAVRKEVGNKGYQRFQMATICKCGMLAPTLNNCALRQLCAIAMSICQCMLLMPAPPDRCAAECFRQLLLGLLSSHKGCWRCAGWRLQVKAGGLLRDTVAIVGVCRRTVMLKLEHTMGQPYKQFSWSVRLCVLPLHLVARLV